MLETETEVPTALEACGCVYIIRECEAQKDYVNMSEASEDLKTKGAVSNRLREWCNIT